MTGGPQRPPVRRSGSAATMDDGSELEFGPGDRVLIPPGHDAEVVGTEPCVVLEFAAIAHYGEGR